MAKYKALKDFYKISEDKSYNIDEEIELSDEIAEPLVKYGFIAMLKVEVKKVKK
jgi:hypothetical protein